MRLLKDTERIEGNKRLAYWLAIGLVSVLSLPITYSVWRSRTTVQPSHVEPLSVNSSSVVALGRVEPQGQITDVAAPATIEGTRIRVAELLVQEGDWVEVGQRIARLDVYERYDAALNLTKEQLRVAQARLNQAQSAFGETAMQQARIDRLQTELDLAQTEYERYQSLFQAGAISASLLDHKQLAVSSLQGQLHEASVTLEQLRTTHQANEWVAQTDFERAMATVVRAEADLNLADVKAPIAGQVLAIHARSGEGVGERGIVSLGQTDQMMVVAEVYETEIGKVQIGDRAVITSQSFTEELRGTVAQIGLTIGRQAILDTDPIADEDARVVEVKIHLDPEDSQRVASLTNLRVKVEI